MTAAEQHPDEGTIHAWLDDALDGPEASRVAVHVASCVACQAAVAEARGLIAGASRIVRALDESSSASEVRWGEGAPPVVAADERSAWRWLRVTPARASIAATILVLLGVTLTRRTANEPPTLATNESHVPSARPTQDSLLNSAIRRRLEETQPPRTVKERPGVSVPVAPPTVAGAVAAVADAEAPMRVAAARSAVAAARDTAGVRADQARAGVAAEANYAAKAAQVETQVAARAESPPPSPAALSARKSARAKPMVAAAAPAVAMDVPVAVPESWAGTWEGRSVCHAAFDSCRDETMRARVALASDGAEVRLSRLSGADEQEILRAACAVTGNAITCPRRAEGEWRLELTGSSLVATLTQADGVRVRRAELVRH